MIYPVALMITLLASAEALAQSTCGEVKLAYGSSECCGSDTADNDASCFVEATTMASDVSGLQTDVRMLKATEAPRMGYINTISNLDWRSTSGNFKAAHYNIPAPPVATDAKRGPSGNPHQPWNMDFEHHAKEGFRTPDKVMPVLDIKPGDTVLEFGPVNFYWIPYFAAAVGKEGKVFYANPPQLKYNDQPAADKSFIAHHLLKHDQLNKTSMLNEPWKQQMHDWFVQYMPDLPASVSSWTKDQAKEWQEFTYGPEQIADFMRSKMPGYHIAEEPMATMCAPLPAGKFDVINMGYVYNRLMLNTCDRATFWANIQAALKPGGRLIVQDFSNGGLTEVDQIDLFQGGALTGAKIPNKGSFRYCPDVPYPTIDHNACNMTQLKTLNEHMVGLFDFYLGYSKGAFNSFPYDGGLASTNLEAFLPTTISTACIMQKSENFGADYAPKPLGYAAPIDACAADAYTKWESYIGEALYTVQWNGRIDPRVVLAEADMSAPDLECKRVNVMDSVTDEYDVFYLSSDVVFRRDKFVVECTKKVPDPVVALATRTASLATRATSLETYTGSNTGECAAVLDTTSDLSAFKWRRTLMMPHRENLAEEIGCFENAVGISGLPGCPESLGNEFVAKDTFRKPCESLSLFGIRPGMKVADIGTIAGYWLPFYAQAVGKLGKVYYGNQPVVSKNDVPWYVHTHLMLRDAVAESGVLDANGKWNNDAPILADTSPHDREVFRKWYEQVTLHPSFDRTDLGNYTKWIYDYDQQIIDVAVKSKLATGAEVLPIQGLNDEDGERTMSFGTDNGDIDVITYQYAYNRQPLSPLWAPDSSTGATQFKALFEALKEGGKLFVVDYSNGEGEVDNADRTWSYCPGVQGFDPVACNMAKIREINHHDQMIGHARALTCSHPDSVNRPNAPLTNPLPYSTFGGAVYGKYFSTALELFSGPEGPWSKSRPEYPYVDQGQVETCPKYPTLRIDARIAWTEAHEAGFTCKMHNLLHDARDSNLEFYGDLEFFYVRNRFVLECTKPTPDPVVAVATRTRSLEKITGATNGVCAGVMDTSDGALFEWRRTMLTPVGAAMAAQGIDIGCFDAPIGVSGTPFCPETLNNEFAAKDFFRKPCQSLDLFGIQPGMKVADFGQIAGFWIPYFAAAVGPEGKVFYGNPPVTSHNDDMFFVMTHIALKKIYDEHIQGHWDTADILSDLSANDRAVMRKWIEGVSLGAPYDATNLTNYIKHVYDYDASMLRVAQKVTESTKTPVLELQGLMDADGERTFTVPGGEKLDVITYQYAYNRQQFSQLWSPDPDTGASMFKSLHAALKPGGKLFVVDYAAGPAEKDWTVAYCDGVSGVDLTACPMSKILEENHYGDFIGQNSNFLDLYSPERQFEVVTNPLPYGKLLQQYYAELYPSDAAPLAMQMITGAYQAAKLEAPYEVALFDGEPSNPNKQVTQRVDPRVAITEALEAGFASCKQSILLRDPRDTGKYHYLDQESFYYRDRFVVECTA